MKGRHPLVPEPFLPDPLELLAGNGAPETISGWQAVADGLLSDECCAFHRNVGISARYSWIYQYLPVCFKWAGMAAIASHHVRLVLFPFRLDTDRTGFVDIPRSLGRRKLLLTQDVNTIRETNNAIFNDIFWVHLAYVAAAGGIEHLRALFRPEPGYAAVLSGFEAIDRGRRVLEDTSASPGARQTAEDVVWEGNLRLLEHEQRALVQPHFDRLSCTFARLVSIGSATNFEVRGGRHEVGYFTSFYLYALTRAMTHGLRPQTWPRITRYDDRWPWLVTCVVPRFRRFDSDTQLVDMTLRRILADARYYASMPCVVPGPPETIMRATALIPPAGSPRPAPRRGRSPGSG